MSIPTSRTVRLALVVAIAAAGLALAGSGFLVMLPALCLLAPLLCGCYPGAARLDRARRSFTLRRLRLGAATAPGERRGHALVYRGGRLIAAAIAVRPPPLAR